MTPSPVAAWLTKLLIRDLEGFGRELARFPGEADLWRLAPGVANSAGTLALHVSGNLQHFIGAVLGGSGYRRDRAREFSARDVPRADLLEELARTAASVVAVVPGLTDEALAAPYPERVGGVAMVTGQLLLHLEAHLAFHLGQAGYLRRVLVPGSGSADPLPLSPLAGHEDQPS